MLVELGDVAPVRASSADAPSTVSALLPHGWIASLDLHLASFSFCFSFLTMDCFCRLHRGWGLPRLFS